MVVHRLGAFHHALKLIDGIDGIDQRLAGARKLRHIQGRHGLRRTFG